MKFFLQQGNLDLTVFILWYKPPSLKAKLALELWSIFRTVNRGEG